MAARGGDSPAQPFIRRMLEPVPEDELLDTSEKPLQKPPKPAKCFIKYASIRKLENHLHVTFTVDCEGMLQYFERFPEFALDNWTRPHKDGVSIEAFFLFTRNRIVKLFEEATIETLEIDRRVPLAWEEDNVSWLRRLFEGTKIETFSVTLNANSRKNVSLMKPFVSATRCTKVQFVLLDTRICDMLKELRKESFAKVLCAIGVQETTFEFDNITSPALNFSRARLTVELDLFKNYVSAGLLNISFDFGCDPAIETKMLHKFMKWLANTGKDVNITILARRQKMEPVTHFACDKYRTLYKTEYQLKPDRGQLYISKV